MFTICRILHLNLRETCTVFMLEKKLRNVVIIKSLNVDVGCRHQVVFL